MLAQLLGGGLGLLEDVVQHAGGHDLVAEPGADEERGDLERVQEERRRVGLPALAIVALRGEVDRRTRERPVGDEGRQLIVDQHRP